MKQDMLLATVAAGILITAQLTSPVDGIFDSNGIAYIPQLCWAGLPKGCYNTLPGVDKMMLGIDITELDLFPLNSKQPGGFRKPVVNLVCASRSHMPDGASTEQRPNQINEILSLPMGRDEIHSTVIKSSSDIKKFLSVSASASGSSAMGAFSMSASASYKHMERAITEHRRSVQYASVVRSVKMLVYKESSHKEMELDPLTQSVFDKLPETYESNRALYERFIDNYGTHYFHSASFGGTVTQYQETQTDYAYSKKEQDLKTEAEASFYGMVTVGVKVEMGKKTETEKFNKHTISSTRYFGGNTNLLDKGGLKSWQSSLNVDPWLMGGSLASITELIKHDDQKKGQLKKAIDEYIMRKQLKDLFRKVNRASSKNDHAELYSLTERLRALERSEFLVLKDMIDVSKDIEYNLDVPGWFYSDTKLCMRPRDCDPRRGDKCAIPNFKTDSFPYDKDTVEDKCKVQWTITTQTQENDDHAWFKKVKLCFRASGPKECGGNKFRANADVCAPINGVTGLYQITDTKGCQLSWSLRVPDEAPLWFKLVKFCTVALGGGCRGAGPEICVVDNQWTPTFQVLYDVRTRCSVSWGMFLDL